MSTVQSTGTQHPVVRGLARGTVVLLGDLAVLGLTFFTYAAYQSLFRALFFRGDVAPFWFTLEDVVFLGAVGVVTGIVLWRWPQALGTALWLAVPAAVGLAALGVATYPASMLAIGVGAGIVGIVDAVLLLSGRPWEQVLSITWVALLLLVTVLTGTEI